MSSAESPAAPRAAGVAANLLALLTGTFLNQVINLAYMTFAFRLAGKQVIGEFSNIQACVTLLLPIVAFGRPMILAREVAIADSPRQHALLRVALLQQLLFGAGAFALLAAAAPFTPGLIGLEGFVAIAAASLLFNAWFMVAEPYFQGVRRMIVSSTASVLDVATRAGLGTLLLLGAWQASDRATAAHWPALALLALVIPLAVSAIVSSVYFFLAYRRATGRALLPGRSAEGGPLMREGGQLALSQVTSSVYNRFDWLLLGGLKDAATLGVYSTAYRLFEVAMRVPGLIAVAVFPNLAISEHAADADGAAQRRRIDLALRVAVLPGSVVAVFTWWWGEPMALLLLGEEARGVGLILALLCASLPFAGICGIYYHLAIARRRQFYIFYTSGFTALLNVALCLLLIPRYAGLGAAASMAIPMAVQALTLSLAARVPLADLAAGLLHVARYLLLATGAALLAARLPLHWAIQLSASSVLLLTAVWTLGGLDATAKQALLQRAAPMLPVRLRRVLVRSSS